MAQCKGFSEYLKQGYIPNANNSQETSTQFKSSLWIYFLIDFPASTINGTTSVPQKGNGRTSSGRLTLDFTFISIILLIA